MNVIALPLIFSSRYLSAPTTRWFEILVLNMNKPCTGKLEED